MSAPAITMDVRRIGEQVAVVDIKGEVTAACEPVLMSAYEAAGGGKTSRLVLNFAGLEYMNSGGIGMLVTLLVRANRQRQAVPHQSQRPQRQTALQPCDVHRHAHARIGQGRHGEADQQAEQE